MKKKTSLCLVALVCLAVAPARGQFTASELAARPDWEGFLRKPRSSTGSRWSARRA
ncbi:MAG: hypothetical protein M0C28_38585 [Candidatus Moduliflexus flocculans]|nr:hypothetical protein [Candidatus Moduliflexus flocculans]